METIVSKSASESQILGLEEWKQWIHYLHEYAVDVLIFIQYDVSNEDIKLRLKKVRNGMKISDL